jgi:transcription initiation factor TFIIB
MNEPHMDASKGENGCPKCETPSLIYDPISSETVCYQCGMVMSEKHMDRGPEWRAFTLEEKDEKRRASGQTSFTYYDKGLHTSFDTDKDSHGRQLKPSDRGRMRRLRRWNIRSKFDMSGMRNLSLAMVELNRLTDILHLSDVVKEMAAILYRKALEKDLIRGRTIDGFVAASIYAACRQSKTPRSLKEVSKASTMDNKDVSRTYRLLLYELELKMPIDYPMKFVPNIASKVGVSRKTDQLAVEILREAQRQKALAGKDPRAIAAAALYMASKANNEGFSQDKIAEAAKTTGVTLRNRLKDLKKIISTNKLDYLLATIENTTIIQNEELLIQ